jgi:hypothetical protein
MKDSILSLPSDWMDLINELPSGRRLVVLRALGMVGTGENPPGSNRGKDIDFWLRRCGVPIPKDPKTPAPQNAWCAAAASWALSVEGEREVKLAKVKDFVRTFPTVAFQDTLPGDLGYKMHSDGTGHIWLLAGRDDTSQLTMNIEGNTNNAMRLTTRPRADYLRVLLDNTAVMPGILPEAFPAGSATR